MSNGDISEAINLIFNGVGLTGQDRVPEYPDTGYDYPTDEKRSVPIESGLIDDKIPPPSYDYDSPPQVPPRQPRPVHIEDVQHPSQSQIPLSDAGYIPDSETQRYIEQQQQSQAPQYSIYDDPTKYEREASYPPLLMPIRNGMLESYLNPFLTILHEIPAFRSAIYHHEFETLGFHPRWYRGEPINIPDGTTIKVKNCETHDLRFLLEIQRVFGFLDGDSKRSFAAINNFVKSFPRSVRKDFGTIDNIYEAYAVFYNALCAQLSVTGVENALSFFESSVSDNTGEPDRAFGMFHVEAEELKRDLYTTLNTLLWGECLDNDQTLTKLSDVLTISFEPSFEENITSPGIEVPEKFYPQIYGPDFKNTMTEIVNERIHFDKERRTISKELMNLRAFNGKHVSSILNTSIEFLSSESEMNKADKELANALEDLQSIKSQNQDRISHLTDKQSEILDKRSKINPNDINVILKRHGSIPEPYLLTGVILSNNEYYFLKKNKSKDLIDLGNEDEAEWFHVIYEPKYGNDFRIKTTEFESIKRSIYATSQGQYETSIVLIYVKESTWSNEVEYEVPEAVKTFLSRDKLELDKALELLVSSTDEDISDYDGENEGNTNQEGGVSLNDDLEDVDVEVDIDDDKENAPPSPRNA